MVSRWLTRYPPVTEGYRISRQATRLAEQLKTPDVPGPEGVLADHLMAAAGTAGDVE